MRLAMRNRLFLFFSLIMPLGFLFIYATIFGGGEPGRVAYLMPSVLALTVMGSFWGLSVQLVLYREQGILRRFRLTPLGAFAMLVSGILANYLLTLPTIIIEFVLIRAVWKVNSFGNLFGVIVLLTLGTMTFAAFGLIVASVAGSMQETQVINNVIWMLFLFFSGATFPIVFFPAWLQRASVFLPATHLVVGLQYVFIGGVSLRKILPELVALLAGLAMALAVATKLFRWEPDAKVSRKAKLAAAAVVIPFLLVGVWENSQDARRKELRAIYEAAIRQGAPAPPAAPPPQKAPE